MQLFSPKKAKVAHTAQKADEISQIAYLQVTLQKLQNQINTENDNFEKRMAEQRELYTAEKIKLQNEVRSLESAVEQLRKERKELMIPIDSLKEEAEVALKRAQDKLKDLDEREDDLNDLEQNLLARIDAIMQREEQVEKDELSLAIRKKGIDSEAEMIANSHRSLNVKIARNEADYQKRMKVLVEREKAVEAKISANMTYLAEEKSKINRKEQFLNDRLEMLERELGRIKKK